MEKLEWLLNSLIEKGWEPRGEEEIKSCQIGESFYKRNFIGDTVGFYVDDRGTPQWLFTKSLREVCAKSSGLRQFVGENKLSPKKRGYKRENDEGNGLIYYCDEYQYFIIESALKDESELESFILDNVKIDGE